MPIHRSQYLKHTDLFLVRVWTEVEDGADANGNVAGKAEWHGRVQRVIDGEVHQFNSLQALTNLLSDMLSGPQENL